MVPIADLVDIKKTISEKSIYRKNQKRVVYVTGRYGWRIGKSCLCYFGNG